MIMASAKDIVMEYFQATDRQDWQSARSYLSDNFSYLSPVNSFDRAEPLQELLENLIVYYKLIGHLTHS